VSAPIGSGGRQPHALVYGDVNLNSIDGSAIWAPATVEVLAGAGCRVTLLLKGRVMTTRLIDPIQDLPGVRVVRPFEEGLHHDPEGVLMSPDRATKVMRLLDAEDRFDFVVLRGLRAVRKVVDNGGFDGRMWTYLTDIPQALTVMNSEIAADLDRIADASRLLLCQTEELRSFLEATVPRANGKCVLFPPILPAQSSEPVVRDPLDGRPLRLAYSGKFAPLWQTEALTRLPGTLADRGIPAELHAVGDKIHKVPGDPTYHERMENALRESPGVIWHGGRSRHEAVDLVARCDIGMSWRDRSLDASLELSTKVLEYGAVHLPVVLNRTPMHESLLGIDYPLFANDEAEVADVVELAAREPGVRNLAAERASAAAAGFTLERAISAARRNLDRVFPSAPALARPERRLRVGVASHDLKFFSRLLDQLRAMPEIDVMVDEWSALAVHDPTISQELVDWADVIVCEWFGPNALWYSQHRRLDQRLIVRLHRFELYGPWPAQADIGAIDRVVCVSPYYADLVRERTGWPADKVTVIANWVDDAQLDRPKLPGARFHIGMVGIGETRKRFDLALDVLEQVRRHDPRFRLFAKTKMPWDYAWIWRRPGEPEATDAYLRRIQVTEKLRGAVVFDQFGPDVASWLRRVGFILSTSDDESFHLAPAEGMASGAIPVVRTWPGAEMIYESRWIHDDPAEMAHAILTAAQPARWEQERAIAREQARAGFGLDRIVDAWVELLNAVVSEPVFA
jgi:glycosyltransferase involved in cell wall biosynthesis